VLGVRASGVGTELLGDKRVGYDGYYFRFELSAKHSVFSPDSLADVSRILARIPSQHCSDVS
jgi:hypothetical protein